MVNNFNGVKLFLYELLTMPVNTGYGHLSTQDECKLMSLVELCSAFFSKK